MQMWYSDGTPKLRHIAPPGIFIISTFSSQSCQSLVNTSKESIELFECQRKSTCARRVLFQLADGLSVFSHTRPPSSLFDQYCSSDSPVNVFTSRKQQLFVEEHFMDIGQRGKSIVVVSWLFTLHRQASRRYF